ncbi:hypothetical protein H8S90_10610 [Olivibacter sp. SDN3]|uniref:DUF6266 family protein n=1 Tax=Olivibacter sp. SDN3 TaxID=2764720 RepID=UPI0016517157|nr:DUF6266 family protein [Olivibacter sp. SDN3]QNL51979.1 hypothetical protein H8S90_10610 [Olivibacter sp. SDN3]
MLIISERFPPREKGQNGREATRMRLILAVRYLSPLRKIIAQGYGLHSKRSAFNRAVADLIRSAIQGEYPDLSVDPARVRLTKGILQNPIGLQLTRLDDQLQLHFETNVAAFYSSGDDSIVLCAYNPELGIAGINDEECSRQDGSLSMQLPAQLMKAPVHVYCYAHDRQRKRFSNSLFLGAF